MSSMTQPPQPGFRLSQLLYDSRYRSMTIQVIAFAALLALIYWLGANIVSNLEALDKDFKFSFLDDTYGVDIKPALIPFQSTDSNLRAFTVGGLNTILVAFLGCILATIIGVFVGVLRLSKNWIVSRLAAVYVEMFRNVPLLLWIFLAMAFLTESLPHPKEFAAEGGPNMLLGGIAVTKQGTFIPSPIWNEGSRIVVIVFLLSLVGIFLFRNHAKKVQMSTGRQLPVMWVGLALFFIPALLAFFALGQPIGLDVPEAGRFKFQGGVHLRNSFMALWIALSLYTAAFIAEIVRAGIMAVSKGQSEAAAALGLRPGRAMRLVILPQAMRVIIPPLISQFLNLTKNSSLAIAASYMDFTQVVNIGINKNGRELEGMLIIGLYYLALSLAISLVMNMYNNRIKLKER